MLSSKKQNMHIITPTEMKKKLYGINFVLAGMYLNNEKPYWIFHLLYSILVLIDLNFSVVTVAGTVYDLWGSEDLSLLLKQINYVLIRFVTYGLVINGIFQSKKMDNLFMKLKMYNYTIPLDENQQKIFEDYDKEFKFVMYFFRNLMYFVSLVWIIALPISEIIFSEFIFAVPSNETIKFSKYLPVLVWHPYDPDVFISFVIQYFAQVFMTFVLAHAASGTVASYIDLSTYLVSSFKILQLSIQDITIRAYKMYTNEKKGERMDVKDIEKLDLSENTVYQDCLIRSLKENLEHHLQLQSVQKEMIKIYGPYMLFLLVISGIFLCTKAVTLLEMHNDPHKFRNLFRFAQSVTCFTAFIYIFCWYGEQIAKESSMVHNYLHYCSWYNNCMKFKKLLLIMMTCTQKPLNVSCVGLKTLNLQTFSEMCSATYSYFSLLRSMKVD